MKKTLIRSPIHSNHFEAIEIFDYLKDKLSLPDNVIEFRVTFKLNSPLVVECSYYPNRIGKNEQLSFVY